MALPKIDIPVYNLELPLSKRTLKFRPFLVKEQRNLLMAMEADDAETIEDNIRQVLTNCTVFPENLDVAELPIVDIEYYFLQLRAKSVGEIVENRYKCNNLVGNSSCGNIMDVKVNLNDIGVQKKKDVSDVIQLNDRISIKLKYPQFGLIRTATKASTATQLAFDTIASSIEYIYDGEQFYYAKETDPKELTEFIESLNNAQFKKIEEFFDNLPTLSKTVEMKCSRCGYDHKIDVEGLESFFD